MRTSATRGRCLTWRRRPRRCKPNQYLEASKACAIRKPMPNTTTIAAMASSINDLLRSSSVTKKAPAQSKKFAELRQLDSRLRTFGNGNVAPPQLNFCFCAGTAHFNLRRTLLRRTRRGFSSARAAPGFRKILDRPRYRSIQSGTIRDPPNSQNKHGRNRISLCRANAKLNRVGGRQVGGEIGPVPNLCWRVLCSRRTPRTLASFLRWPSQTVRGPR
jgi:hypothetical protein